MPTPPPASRTPAAVRVVVLVALCGLVLSACGGSRSLGGPQTAARVDGQVITTATLERLIGSQLVDPQGGGGPARPGPEDYGRVGQLQRETLAQLIQDTIVAQAADDLGIEVDPEEVERRFQEAARSFGGAEGLREEIARRGRTEEDVREQLAAVVRRDELQAHFEEQAEVSGRELRQAYRELVATRYRVADTAHILVGTEEEAREILEELEQGADFARLAEERSLDEASGAAGGELGENPSGAFVEPFDEAVWSAEPGEVVGPVQTQFGFHVIRVEGFRTIGLSEVRDQLREELLRGAGQEAFDAWFREQLTRADVVVADRFGRWNADTGRVEPAGSLPPVRQPAAEDGQQPGDDRPVGPEATPPAVSPTG